MVVICNGELVGRSGWAISASDTPSIARATATLMRCQLPRKLQLSSWAHRPASTLHSVIAMGPSIADMISATLTSAASRTNAYPPAGPRKEATR